MGNLRLILAALMLCSCGPNKAEVSPAVSYTPQPIQVYQQPYPMQCTDRLPMAPVCVTMMGGSLDSMLSGSIYERANFEACKSDVERFVAAVKFQAECYEKSLKDYVENAVAQISSRIICEEQEILKIESGGDGQACPAIFLPPIPDMLSKDDYRSISGINPIGVTTFACDMIKDLNDPEMRQLCVDELSSGFPNEAQTYYEEQLKYFYNGGRLHPKREGVKKYINNVVEEFNCKASGQTFCF